jgi:magnesium chelatase family protein
VRVSRAKASVAFPARFLLVGATNPCPCGEGGRRGMCRCTNAARARYHRRLSGPLLDRFDLRVLVGRPDVGALLGGRPGEPTAAVADRVVAARERARARGVAANADIPSDRLDAVAPLSAPAAALLEQRLRTGTLSGRGLHRVRRVARTVADLDGAPALVTDEHVSLALGLRADVVATEVAA